MIRLALAAVIALVLPAVAFAQDIALGGLTADPTAPVEVSADSLSVDRTAGTAVFEGNVVIGQGDMRIGAGRVEVFYDEASGDIVRLLASAGVTFVTATEAAESATADYDLTAGLLVLRGDVLLRQGTAALAADAMTVNLTAGTARMEGRVRTVFGQGGD